MHVRIVSTFGWAPADFDPLSRTELLWWADRALEVARDQARPKTVLAVPARPK